MRASLPVLALTMLVARPALAAPPDHDGAASGPKPRALSEPDPDPDGYRALRFTGGITMGVTGLLAVMLGSVYGVRTLIEKGAIGDHCDAKGRCDLAGYTHQSDAHDSATLSTIGFSVGLPLVAAGVVLAVTAAPRRAGAASGPKPQAPREPRAAVWMAPGPRGVVAGVRW